MFKILVNHKNCKIIGECPSDFLKKLNNHLSYRQEGVEYTAAFKNHGWNGMVYLMNKKMEFPRGLLDRVKQFAIEHDQEVFIEDTRVSKQLGKEIDIQKQLKVLNLIPRDYQIKAMESCLENDLGIVRAATGSGKSLITAMVTAKIAKPTLILVIGKSLLYQFHTTFSNIFINQTIGLIGDGNCNIENISIATIWTVARALGIDVKKILNLQDDTEEEKDILEQNKTKILSFLSKVNLIILDECHVDRCQSVQSIYKAATNLEYFYGFSGTPFKLASQDLETEALLGNIIYQISASELIEQKVLAQPIIKFFDVPGPTSYSGKYPTIYKNYIVENTFRNNLIVEQTIKLLNKGYITLVLFSNLKHGKILYELFNQQNIECSILDGTDSQKDRKKVQDQVEKGKLKLLLASKIFNIGLDLPILSGLVLADGGKSFILANQKIGRVIRGYPGKKYAAVVEFYDNAKYLKQHSKKRREIYQMEPGFKVIWFKDKK